MGCNNSKAVPVNENSAHKKAEPITDETPSVSPQTTPKNNASHNPENEQEKVNIEPVDEEQQQEIEVVEPEKVNAIKKPITLGYWGIKGRAYPARLILTHKNVDFEDKCYTKDTAKNWFAEDKPNLGKKALLNLPNLPYLIDRPNSESDNSDSDDTHIFQSMAVLKYLGRKYDLNPAQSEQEKLLADMWQAILVEIMESGAKAYFNKETDTLKEKLAPSWSAINDHLQNHQFMCGDKLSWIDFLTFSHIEMFRKLDDKILEGMEEIQKFEGKMLELDNVKKYVKIHETQPWFP